LQNACRRGNPSGCAACRKQQQTEQGIEHKKSGKELHGVSPFEVGCLNEMNTSTVKKVVKSIDKYICTGVEQCAEACMTFKIVSSKDVPGMGRNRGRWEELKTALSGLKVGQWLEAPVPDGMSPQEMGTAICQSLRFGRIQGFTVSYRSDRINRKIYLTKKQNGGSK
jgi:hypothetical protein